MTTIELSPNLHLISEDEFVTHGRGDYSYILVGKFDLRNNVIEGVVAPVAYGAPVAEGNEPLFSYVNGRFRIDGITCKSTNPLRDNLLANIGHSLERQELLWDDSEKRWLFQPKLVTHVDADGNIFVNYESEGSVKLKLPATVLPNASVAVILDELSLNRINVKTNSISLMNDGAVAVSHVLVGVGVADAGIPAELEGVASRVEELDTPFYKAFTVETAQLPQSILDEYNIELTPSQQDMRRTAAALEECDFFDDRLHQDQLEAVRVHLSTELGFVNALQTGDGKTIATLVGMDARSRGRHGAYVSLVVLEASVRKQWMGEAETWLGDEWEVVTITTRSDTENLRETLDRIRANDGRLLVLCSYNMAADAEEEETELGQILANERFNDVILDEGRTVRGHNKTARALGKVRDNAEIGIILCATPVTKSVNDLGMLMAWARNDDRISGSHLAEMFPFTAGSDVLEDMRGWYEWWGPTLIRSTTSREKRAEAMQRPRIRTEVEFIEATPHEAHVSQMIMGKVKDALQEIIDMYKAMGENITPEQERQLRGSILATQSVARMAASDPRILANSDSAIAHLLRAEGVLDFPPGFIPAKMLAAVEKCMKWDDPAIVFCEYTDTAKSMVEELKARGVSSVPFIGGGGKKRDEYLDSFRKGDAQVLVATSAAERGLNLQNARYGIHYDHKFTPDTIFQRTGRQTRIGSEYTEVDALFLVTSNTVDERVFSVSVARAGLAGATAAKSVEDFAESDAAGMLKVLVEHANPVRLANQSQVGQLELTSALCS